MNSIKIGDLVKINPTTVGTVRCIYPVCEGSDNLLAEVRVRHQTELCNVKALEVIDRGSLRWRVTNDVK